MIKKSRRLTRKDFLITKKTGHTVRTNLFSALFKSSNLGFSRFAIVTSAKLAKSAVVRNHLRRQIYSQLSTLNFQLTVDLILIPSPSVLNLSHETLRLELDTFLSKVAFK